MSETTEHLLCPLCGRPALWSKTTEQKCSPLSGCAAWSTTAVWDRKTRTWLPVDSDGYTLDGRYVGPTITEPTP